MRIQRNQSLLWLLVISFSLSIVPANADVTPSPSPTSDPQRNTQDQFKKDRDAFALAKQNRESTMRDINFTFKVAVDKATADAKLAMASATTPEKKNIINSTRRTAITSAIVTRDEAIAALGPVPTPPAQQQRTAKSSPEKNSDEKEKRKR